MIGCEVILALAALQAAPPAPPRGPAVDDARVRTAVEEILSGPEYRRLRGRRAADPEAQRSRRGAPSEETSRSFEPTEPEALPSQDRLPASTGPLFSAAAVRALQIFVFALLAAAVLGLAVVAIRSRRSSPPGPTIASPAAVTKSLPAAQPGDRAADEYLQQARAQARAGRHREAIRLLLVGAMSFIERRGLIRHRQGLTNGDYLRSVRGDALLRRSLEPLVLTFDELYFGRREADADRFDHCVQHYEAAFRER